MKPETNRVFDNIAMPVLLFAASLALMWFSGALHSEFGRYADEGMHYITGVFIQDYLTSGHWSHPMAFALDYYLHFPKIALGNWPPGFSLMQVAWALVFGVSRLSMLLGMSVLTAWLAWLVYREGARRLGPLYGTIAALFLIAAPLTQSHTAMVMAEIPLAAVSLLAILAAVRFIEASRTRDAVVFALWTSAAIMIKGNGWDIVLAAPLIVLATGRVRLFGNYRFWLAAGIIGVLCAPYTLFTMRIVSQGWDTTAFPGFAYLWASLGIHAGFATAVIGIPLTACALIGVAGKAAVPTWRQRSQADPYWLAMTVYGLTIIVFHVAVPTSIEARKIYQLTPVLCLFAVAGIETIARAIPARVCKPRIATTGLAAAAVIVFLVTCFSALPEFAPGYGPAVADIISRGDTRGAAVLISSNPQWVDAEAALIAEWASRERHQGTYLIRGSKLLSHPEKKGPAQADFVLNFTTEDEVRKALTAIPVAYVLIHTTQAPNSYPHHELLRKALEDDPAEWEPIYHSIRRLESPAQTHAIEIYRFRKSLAGVPVRYSVDLANKLGVRTGTKQ